MFKKPTKVKLKESSVKLTESASTEAVNAGALVPSDQGAQKENTSASPNINKADRIGKMAGQRPGQATGKARRVVFEKPSRLLVTILLTVTLGSGTVATLVTGPLAPFSASISHSYQLPYLALIILDGALYRDPRNTELLIQRATERETIGAHKQALQDINLAISLLPANAPDLAGAYALQGQILLELNRRVEAEVALKKAGELNKYVATDFHERAFKALEFSKNPKLAIKLETLALLIDPNLPKSYLNRSNGYWQTNQYQKAVDDCTTALALPVDWSSGHYPDDLQQELLNHRSDAFYALGDYQSSIRDALAAADLARKTATNTAHKPSPRPTRSLVKAYLAANQPDMALIAIDAVKEKIVRDGPLLLMQKQALLMLKKELEAQTAGPSTDKEIDQAFWEFDSDAIVYLYNKDYRNTINACNLALLARPNEFRVLRMRAEAYRGLKMWDRVVEDTTSALSRETVTQLKGWLFFMRAEANENLNHAKEAAQDFKDAASAGYTKKWVRDSMPN